MNIHTLQRFLSGLQDAEGRFVTENPVKATAEYLLVHRLCPNMNVGNIGKARIYLKEQLPPFAVQDVTKGFKSMEKIWQIAVGIPEETLFLSDALLRLSRSGVSVSVKSSLALVLLLQGQDVNDVVKEVITYQKQLFKTVSLDNMYETTHNVMTFFLTPYTAKDIIAECCEWLSLNMGSFSDCIDLLAETVGVLLLCGYKKYSKMLSVLSTHQNEDGGYPIFVGGESAFHPSLVSLWAFTASGL